MQAGRLSESVPTQLLVFRIRIGQSKIADRPIKRIEDMS